MNAGAVRLLTGERLQLATAALDDADDALRERAAYCGCPSASPCEACAELLARAAQYRALLDELTSEPTAAERADAALIAAGLLGYINRIASHSRMARLWELQRAFTALGGDTPQGGRR